MRLISIVNFFNSDKNEARQAKAVGYVLIIDQMRPSKGERKKSEISPPEEFRQVDSHRHKLRRGRHKCDLKEKNGSVRTFILSTSNTMSPWEDLRRSMNFSHWAVVYGNVDKLDVRLSK